jgi:hypothetical protein
MTLKFRAIIKKDGKVVTEVLDRGKHLCTEVYKVTNSVGRQLSDEETGPEGDTVHEVSRA